MRGMGMMVLAAALGLCGCHKRGGESAPPPFTERFDGKNGLVTLHYPAGFTASQDGKHSLILARGVAGGRDEALSFVAVPNAVSSDLEVFAKKVQDAGASQLNQYKLGAQKRTRCLGIEAVETTGTWVDAASGGTIVRRSCAFLHAGHGYVFSYSIPQDLVPSHDPLLHTIVEATELK